MSIKPVDYQIMVPKTSEVSKMYSSEAQKLHAVHQQATATVQNNAENSIRQVHSQDRVNEVKIKEKQEKERGTQKEQGKKEEEKEKEKSKGTGYPVRVKQESIIDIKI